jgi:DNA-binding PadR family transcriptional regulator
VSLLLEKAVLQLILLEKLSSNKQLSKSQARKILEGSHHWPEISNAFDKLKTRGFIEAIARDTGKPGKPEILYRLTVDGIAVLITENPSSDRFWSLMMHYCYSREDNEEVSKQTIDDFYDFFQ